MRIIAGTAKGTRLAPVPAGTRPVSDRAREGLFSSLGDRVVGARVLDLFAGTGAMGIEALSRGAETCLFVDSAPAATRTIAQNLNRARLVARGTVRRLEALRAIRQESGRFDLVLVDPPYAMPGPALDDVLGSIAEFALVTDGGRVVLTRSTKSYTPVIPLHWRVERRLAYGDTVLLVYTTS